MYIHVHVAILDLPFCIHHGFLSSLVIAMGFSHRITWCIIQQSTEPRVQVAIYIVHVHIQGLLHKNVLAGRIVICTYHSVSSDHDLAHSGPGLTRGSGSGICGAHHYI